MFVVPNALTDPRFCNNPLVTGPPDIRFYAGAALIVSGVKIGSLCIIDRVPHEDFGLEDRTNLLDLGEAVATLIRIRRESNLNHCKFMIDSIRNPLLSLGETMSHLTKEKNMIYSSLTSSSESQTIRDTLELRLNELQSSVENMKVAVETNVLLADVALSRDVIANQNGITSPMDCNILDTIQSARAIVSNFHPNSNIEWNLSLQAGQYQSHPQVVTLALVSTLSDAVSRHDRVHVDIVFVPRVAAASGVPVLNEVDAKLQQHSIQGYIRILVSTDGLKGQAHAAAQSNGVVTATITCNAEVSNDNIVNNDKIRRTSLANVMGKVMAEVGGGVNIGGSPVSLPTEPSATWQYPIEFSVPSVLTINVSKTTPPEENAAKTDAPSANDVKIVKKLKPKLTSSVSLPDNLNILVVDDNFAIQNLMTIWLEGRGCRVVTVENGKQALDLLKTEEFDITLMDFLMVRYYVFFIIYVLIF